MATFGEMVEIKLGGGGGGLVVFLGTVVFLVVVFVIGRLVNFFRTIVFIVVVGGELICGIFVRGNGVVVVGVMVGKLSATFV